MVLPRRTASFLTGPSISPGGQTWARPASFHGRGFLTEHRCRRYDTALGAMGGAAGGQRVRAGHGTCCIDGSEVWKGTCRGGPPVSWRGLPLPASVRQGPAAPSTLLPNRRLEGRHVLPKPPPQKKAASFQSRAWKNATLFQLRRQQRDVTSFRTDVGRATLEEHIGLPTSSEPLVSFATALPTLPARPRCGRHCVRARTGRRPLTGRGGQPVPTRYVYVKGCVTGCATPPRHADHRRRAPPRSASRPPGGGARGGVGPCGRSG